MSLRCLTHTSVTVQQSLKYSEKYRKGWCELCNAMDPAYGFILRKGHDQEYDSWPVVTQFTAGESF